MSQIIDLSKLKQKTDVLGRIEAMDVKGKIIFVYLPGDELRGYFGDKVWEGLRKLGAASVVFCPDHMRVQDFNDEDLAKIGLKRISHE